jgi:ribonucleotide monophosphatase NagD (HAD superfamily)
MALQAFCKDAYGINVDVVHFGKPSSLSFEYAKQVLDKQANNFDLEISKYFMIGDNPSGDIKGANKMGWESILV